MYNHKPSVVLDDKARKVKREYFPAKISMANISKTSTLDYIFFFALLIPLLIPYLI